ncbi:chromosomal replication initiator protein DnaA [Corynebacterium sp. HS2168-gen11]|uniref:chromosomal replication initiator protein DnaA n=1 Tax=Corynebacterium sp. HS2168-gen11 TaxID=2974027 RepID=UPI00216B0569|nr:chromosomal replication initiator protein DnaA [Corynebacterium sp. HS2168-gen11]MCS4535490.1 chromosomal replication initiator protein DnaA [Corynebacterium sp. HS2168-gen11]
MAASSLHTSSFPESWSSIVDEVVQFRELPDHGPKLSKLQQAYLSLVRPIGLMEGVAIISVPHEHAKEFIEKDLAELITDILSSRMGRSCTLAITVHREEEPDTQPAQQAAAPTVAPVAVETVIPQHQQPHTWSSEHVSNQQPIVESLQQPVQTGTSQLRNREVPAHDPNRDSSLNPRYTFDTYVVSDSNKLPTSAAIAVSEKPALAYNPLFIWGDSGLGKTHLMHAIGNYAKQLHPSLRIKYVSSEEFTNDYINSVRDDRQETFKRRYRNLDILMVDDIQFLQGKEGTQEEFFHTFNALQQNGKQIVLSSDRPPKQLTTLEDRLRTRFQAGLIADIYPPDLETRIAILSKKAQADGIEVGRDVLELIASRFNSSIRELEGAFIRLSAFASLNNQPIDLTLAEITLRDIMPDEVRIEITAEIIQEVIADYFGLTIEQLTSATKSRPLAHARQLAMYLCRELTELSLPKIGDKFGGRDHSTVVYADRKVRKEISEKRQTYDEIQKLTTMIKNHGR